MSPAQRAASSPYPRRPSAQPKSSRQQFSACGACRMRRVRCDLKDLPVPVTGPNPACSNCKERGLKCVDEFADVKAVKLLRRGRRLQQVEAIYGKAAEQSAAGSSSSYLGLPTRLPSTIPPLQPEFFSSAFWHWFKLQRPILDPVDFEARFCAHAKGSHPFGPEGSLLAMLLVVWAASFGVDEYGVPIAPNDHHNSMASASNDANIPPRNHTSRKDTSIDSSSNFKSPVGHAVSAIRGRKERSEAMLREVLDLIDIHAVIRRPTWNGVRVLLLILPLLEDVHPLERITLHEASLSQVHSLCNFALSASGPSSLSHSSEDAIIRARIFWYAYIQEGITTGMRGGRMVLNEEDFEDFQSSLPPLHGNGVNYTSGLPSPTSPTFPPDSAQLPRGSPSAALSGGVHPYLQFTHLFSIPLRLGAVCRKVHSVLTGKRAGRRIQEAGGIDAEGMRDIWDGLESCWEEFESLRRSFGGDVMAGEVDVQVERFVSGWQIFIFECHNIIRESLKQYTSRPSSPAGNLLEMSSPKSFLSPYHLHEIASRKCFRLLPCVLSIIKHHLTHDDVDMAGLFTWDAGLVRDGCFFAAFLSASIDSEQLIDYATRDAPSLCIGGPGRSLFKRETNERNGGGSGSSMLGGAGVDIVRPGLLPILDADEGTRVCLAAIGEMRWALAKSDERIEAIRAVWEENKMKRLASQGHNDHSSFQALNLNAASTLNLHQPYSSTAAVAAMVSVAGGSMHSQSFDEMEFRFMNQSSYDAPQHHHQHGSRHHPVLPPLSTASPSHSGSAPNTACTDGSASGWPSYTPPSTAASGTSAGGRSPHFGTASTSTSGLSTPGSTGGVPFKSEDEMLYHRVSVGLNGVGEFDQFAFSTPGGNVSGGSAGGVSSPTSAATVTVHDPSSTLVTYHQAPRAATANTSAGHHPAYLDFNVSGGGHGSVMIHTGSPDAFVGESSGYYH
ncbi:hypothetical protein K435DRAFT_788229 [Dendrothele bispora CBS 962.96]|uniref:Zn(2)-C6 fungal-type domain-containing protein n=1 Tax=Dendrothele bispora (strain CBS 962.96) TaxID=1314807 RepID=A0A4S8MX14_DENBC|nr:hypothetical protein K435DRAFT_788229 [Dendrothele bispora CBS 962.96]